MVKENKAGKLTGFEIAELQKNARSKLGEYKKTYDIIGIQVFSMLGLCARIIYYPLGRDAPWGFTRMIGSKGEEVGDKPFVAINTSIPVDCQVFAAAHELYHIWYDDKADIVPATLLDESHEGRNELKANRFAAEFLVDAALLRQEIELYGISPNKITIKDILILASLFIVPYRTMVKRLQEIDVIDTKNKERFLAESDENIAKYRKRYSVPIPETDGRIAMDNMVELAVSAYEAELITYEKLEYLLSVSSLKPEDVGVKEPPVHKFPSDEELDSIMDE